MHKKKRKHITRIDEHKKKKSKIPTSHANHEAPPNRQSTRVSTLRLTVNRLENL